VTGALRLPSATVQHDPPHRAGQDAIDAGEQFGALVLWGRRCLRRQPSLQFLHLLLKSSHCYLSVVRPPTLAQL